MGTVGDPSSSDGVRLMFSHYKEARPRNHNALLVGNGNAWMNNIYKEPLATIY